MEPVSYNVRRLFEAALAVSSALGTVFETIGVKHHAR